MLGSRRAFTVARAGKFVRSAVLIFAVAASCGTCLWLPLVTFNDLPPWEATEAARRRSVADGHPVQNAGSMGQYITQPDALGGCEVEVLFGLPPIGERERDVAVRLRRSSALRGWQVTDVAVRESPR
jgi:hypothetical protein